MSAAFCLVSIQESKPKLIKMDSEISFCIKWNGKEYSVNGLAGTQRVADLKERISADTGVLPTRQKLLGLKCKGKAADDATVLDDLILKPNQKIMMMGTREESIAAMEKPPDDLPEVVNDFDIGEEEEIAIENRSEYLAKIDKRISDYKIDIINEPRPGKKLLVLDIDYTLFDHKSVGETGRDLMRPYLHEFLASAYYEYDLVIWSATSMKWIKAKMEELNVTANPNYKLCFMIDSGAMITVQSPRYGIIEVKPLGVIWGKYPQWSAKNTIMFDDIRRNFIMNPQSGLKIRPFRQAHSNRDTDKELFYLSIYLKDISQLDDFTKLNHKHWESYRPRKHRRHENSDRDAVS